MVEDFLFLLKESEEADAEGKCFPSETLTIASFEVGSLSSLILEYLLLLIDLAETVEAFEQVEAEDAEDLPSGLLLLRFPFPGLCDRF